MGEILVKDDAGNEGGVFQATAGLGNDLDVVKVDVLPLEVGYGEHCLDCDVRHQVLALAHHLGAKGGSGALLQELVVVLSNVNLFLDFFNSFDGYVAGLFKAISNLKGVDAFVKEFLGLFEQGSGDDNDTGCAVSDLIVLRLGQFYQ